MVPSKIYPVYFINEPDIRYIRKIPDIDITGIWLKYLVYFPDKSTIIRKENENIYSPGLLIPTTQWSEKEFLNRIERTYDTPVPIHIQNLMILKSGYEIEDYNDWWSRLINMHHFNFP